MIQTTLNPTRHLYYYHMGADYLDYPKPWATSERTWLSRASLFRHPETPISLIKEYTLNHTNPKAHPDGRCGHASRWKMAFKQKKPHVRGQYPLIKGYWSPLNPKPYRSIIKGYWSPLNPEPYRPILGINIPQLGDIGVLRQRPRPPRQPAARHGIVPEFTPVFLVCI